MGRANKIFRFAFQFLLLVLIMVVLIFVINFLGVNQPTAPQVTQQVTNPAYPPPKQALDSPYPPPIKATWTIPIPLSTKSSPLFTPVPTLTLKPGPSPTLIPILVPAKNPAGSLFFVSKSKNNLLVNPQLLSIDAVGKSINGSTKLSDVDLKSGSIIFPSPDGDRLVIVGAWGVIKLFDIAKGNFESVAENLVNVDMFFNWFPDNRQILYGIYTLSLGDPVSGEHIPLAIPGYGGITGAAASPDGQFVVYSYSTDIVNTHGLWIIKSNGQNANLLAKVPATITNISWSPDGKRIAFFGNGWQVINADGSNLQEIANGIVKPQCDFLPPLWSPDSSTLAVVTEETGGSFCYGWGDENYKGTNIMLVDVDSGKAHPLLSDGSTGNIDPAWSPDGTQIAFVSNRSGSPEIWAVNANGTNLHQLSQGSALSRYPVWRRP